MLIRISFIVAIIGGLAVAGVNFLALKDKINTTITERNDFHSKYNTEQLAHQKAQKEANDNKAGWEKTKGELTTAKNEREAAQKRANEESQRARELADNLKNVNQELGTTKDKLARWEGLGTIEQVRGTIDSVKKTIEDKENVIAENKILFARAQRLQVKLNSILISDYQVELPEDLTGKVMAVDPKYDFVVLNVGSKEGVLEDGQMLVSRQGKLIAKVKITSRIESESCVANIVPGWKLGDIMEGDEVLTLK